MLTTMVYGCCQTALTSQQSPSTTHMGCPTSKATQLRQQSNFYLLLPVKGFLKVAPEVTRKHTLPAATGFVHCPSSFCYFIITEVSVSQHAVLCPP